MARKATTETSKIKKKIKKSSKVDKSEFTYIYAIKREDKVMYVGSTERYDISTRFTEHQTDLTTKKHTNKKLSKEYEKDSNFTYEMLYKIPNDSSVLRWFLEMLAISYHQPKCNHCVIQSGRMRLSMSKVPSDLAKEIIDVILKYYQEK
ncbi:MAG: GIY-YIG nuclease family protein [Clostridia bacterium]